MFKLCNVVQMKIINANTSNKQNFSIARKRRTVYKVYKFSCLQRTRSPRHRSPEIKEPGDTPITECCSAGPRADGIGTFAHPLCLCAPLTQRVDYAIELRNSAVRISPSDVTFVYCSKRVHGGRKARKRGYTSRPLLLTTPTFSL